MGQQNKLYDRENVRLSESLQEANKQVAFRQGEVDKLSMEKKFQQQDRDTAETFVDQLTKEREALRVELAELFKVNRQLTQQLAQIQARLEADINKRTEAVGSDSD